jgi:hypothetical protein
MADSANRLGSREVAARNEKEIAGAEAEAAAMDEQVADRHLPGHPRIVHPEFGHMIDDLVVPLDPAAIYQDGKGRDGEGLAGRSDLEDRVGIDPPRAAEPGHSEAARHGRSAVLDDRDRRSGRAEAFAQALDSPLEIGRRIGQRGGRKQEKQEAEEQMRGFNASARALHIRLLENIVPSSWRGSV